MAESEAEYSAVKLSSSARVGGKIAVHFDLPRAVVRLASAASAQSPQLRNALPAEQPHGRALRPSVPVSCTPEIRTRLVRASGGGQAASHGERTAGPTRRQSMISKR